MPQLLTTADEGLHPAGDDPDWQESVYLAWRDPTSGLGGNHRIGNEPNRATANLWCGVYHEDGTRFRHNGEDLALSLVSGGLTAGPQRLFHDGSALRFALDADGCHVDLVIEDVSEVSIADGQSFGGGIFASNFHAFSRVTGTVTLDGRTTSVEAAAWRDHSWGVRRWDGFLCSRSFGGASGDLEFRYGSMVKTDGGFFRYGGLSRGGEPVAVDGSEMLVSVDDDAIRCPAAEVRYHLATGETTIVRIETIGGMVGVTKQRYGWESVGDVSVDGTPGGWGFLEVNNNPRNGVDPPAFAIGETLTNGVIRP